MKFDRSAIKINRLLSTFEDKVMDHLMIDAINDYDRVTIDQGLFISQPMDTGAYFGNEQ